MAQGYHARQDNEWLRVAWLACNALASLGKDPVSPAKLLGPAFMMSMKLRRAGPPVVTDEE